MPKDNRDQCQTQTPVILGDTPTFQSYCAMLWIALIGKCRTYRFHSMDRWTGWSLVNENSSVCLSVCLRRMFHLLDWLTLSGDLHWRQRAKVRVPFFVHHRSERVSKRTASLSGKSPSRRSERDLCKCPRVQHSSVRKEHCLHVGNISISSQQDFARRKWRWWNTRTYSKERTRAKRLVWQCSKLHGLFSIACRFSAWIVQVEDQRPLDRIFDIDREFVVGNEKRQKKQLFDRCWKRRAKKQQQQQ